MIYINVGGARPPKDERDIKDVIDSALGTIDEYGNPFELIDLTYNAPKGRADHYTQGFQAVEINSVEGQPVSIKYKDGSLHFKKNRTGNYVAQIPKTPHNVKKLAACFYNTQGGQQIYLIRDKKQRIEVQALADKIMKERTPEQVKIDEQMGVDRNRTRIDEEAFRPADPDKDNTKKSLVETNRELLEQLHSAREEIENIKKSEPGKAALISKDDMIPKPKPEPVINEELPVKTRAELMKEYNEQEEKARELGLRFIKKPTLGELKSAVIAAQKKVAINDNEGVPHLS